MSDRASAKAEAQQKILTGPSPCSRLLQRKCACGASPGIDGLCTECRDNQLTLQSSRRGFEAPSASAVARGNTSAQENVLSLDSVIDRASRFERDFSRIPVYSSHSPVQTKLTVNQSGDVYEREADQASEQVMRMPHTTQISLQRQCACASSSESTEECAECKAKRRDTLQRSVPSQVPPVAMAVPPIVYNVLSSPSQPLDIGTRRFMEPRFGHDFSQVRIHTDRNAAESARAVKALAYTVGRDVVFGTGQYVPHTDEGRRLLAHELTHVVQQNTDATLHGATIQRQDKKPQSSGSSAAGKVKKSAPTAASAPKLELTPSKSGQPCACLVVVHNDERNARKTAQLMHDNCSYNLALVQPDSGSREVRLPGQTGTFDPNSVFPQEIAEQCINDEKSCRDFLATNTGTTDKDEIQKFVQIQFFLAMSDCSNTFSLPIIALHNNDIQDTKNYLAAKDKAGVTDLKLDIDKSKKETGEDKISTLKELIKKKFGNAVEKELMETSGKTNIFRWCASEDLSRCHIGDPDHPDNVTWVTNEEDFQKLSKKDVNVAFQSDLPRSKKSESEGDLSTLFLIIRNLTMVDLAKLVEQIDMKTSIGILRSLLGLPAIAVDIARIQGLRYINVETSMKDLHSKTATGGGAGDKDTERVQNYEAIVEVLKAVGLHCCGEDPTKAEKSIKEGLKTEKNK